MPETLAQLVKDFAVNPIRSVTAIRSITYGDDVLKQALPLLKVAEDGRGLRYLLELLLTRKLILRPLYDPTIFSREEAIRLAMILRQLDSLLGLSLASDAVENAGHLNYEEAQICGFRLVELLEEIFAGLEILQAKPVLLRHPNAKVRSKASALFARRIEHKDWTKWLEGEQDPRIRANAIESLWGEKRPWVREVFLTASQDENNRVAGNALFGLYLLDEHEGVRLLVQLASHPNPWFRATAAWAMGRTVDVRFREILRALVRQQGPRGEKCAKRSEAHP